MNDVPPPSNNSSSVAFVSGIFNVVHPGHLRLLQFAKRRADRLVVGVLTDQLAGVAAHIPELDRLEGVRSQLAVDECFLIDTSVVECVARLRPTFVVKGQEHLGQENPELEALATYGGKLLFSSGASSLTSEDILRREIAGDRSEYRLPLDYLERHNLTVEHLTGLVRAFRELRVVVVGDLIIDEYEICEPVGMSQEEPTIVVTPVARERFVGGAGIVAMHGSSLGARSTLISVVGADPAGEFAGKHLTNAAVDAQLVTDDIRPTTRKQRFRASGRTLLRVNRLSSAAISRRIQDEIFAQFESAIQDANLLVFSDFNLGVLPRELVGRMIGLGRRLGLPMFADSQSTGSVGDIGRFTGMSLISPTEREARLAMRNDSDGLVVLSEQLRNRSGATHVILTLGGDGLLIYSPESTSGIVTDKIGALNTNPIDVAGAGDSLLITVALSLTAGGSIWAAAAIGSVAAAIQVSRLGNSPIRERELLRDLSR